MIISAPRALQSVFHDAYAKATLIARFMGPIWGQQDPGGPHVGPMNLAIWEAIMCW